MVCITEGDGSVSYSVKLTDSTQSGSGVVKVTDGAGNTCTSNEVLEVSTAISLVSFTAVNVEGEVLLEWETATEIDNAGFNLYRAKSKDGTYKKINNALILAKGGATTGATYDYEDTPGKGKFYYKLEDIDTAGGSTMHGPVKVRVKGAYSKEHRRK